MAGGSFFAGAKALRERVGDNELKGQVVVDQHYALYQHENPSLEHPRGGGPFFLSEPLKQMAPGYMTNLAANVLEGSLRAAMIANMEHLSGRLDPAAPIDKDPNYFRLRRSGNPIVTDDGAIVYNRPPHDPPQPPGSPGT